MSEWILHDGLGYPVPAGTRVEWLRPTGEMGVVTVTHAAGASGRDPQDGSWSPWFWAVAQAASTKVTNFHRRIVAYRLAIDPQAEMDRISARQDMFRKIAEEAVKTDRPVKAPVKERAQ